MPERIVKVTETNVYYLKVNVQGDSGLPEEEEAEGLAEEWYEDGQPTSDSEDVHYHPEILEDLMVIRAEISQKEGGVDFEILPDGEDVDFDHC